jgi:tRNA threonylcarbamoyladenosine biosynthesis protein TsaE
MKITYLKTDLPVIVKDHLLPRLQKLNLITFTGALGAGKTTIIKEILVQSGVTELVTSPTFAYVNTYSSPTKIFHHFDLYRLDSLESFIDGGFDEYLQDENAIKLIEWPQIITSLLTSSSFAKRHCQISLQHHPTKNSMRILDIHD